jgi:hypothetical protein
MALTTTVFAVENRQVRRSEGTKNLKEIQTDYKVEGLTIL